MCSGRRVVLVGRGGGLGFGQGRGGVGAAGGLCEVPGQGTGRLAHRLGEGTDHGDEHTGTAAEPPEDPIHRALGDLLGGVRTPGGELPPGALTGRPARLLEPLDRLRIGQPPRSDPPPDDGPAQKPAQELRHTVRAAAHGQESIAATARSVTLTLMAVRVAAVVFDLDGVLIDSEPVWEDVRRKFVAERGGRWLPDSQQRLMGMNTAEWSRYLATDLGVGLTPQEVAREVIARMIERYRSGLPLLPGAVAAVQRVAARWPLGLASSSPRTLIDAVLDRAGVASSFAATVSTEEVAGGKPAPDVYLEAARRLGVAPGQCAAVEDSANGLRSAHAAGCRVLAVPRPEYPPGPDALALAARTLGGLDELTVAAVDGP